MFEWRGFLIATKLSYGIYLVQFAVYHYNIGKVRAGSHFGIIKSMVNIDQHFRHTLNIDISQVNTNELLWIVFASAILTLLFDYPFSNLKKLIFDSKRAPVISSKLDLNSNEVDEKLEKSIKND